MTFTQVIAWDDVLSYCLYVASHSIKKQAFGVPVW